MNFVNRAIRKVGCVSNLFKMRPASVPAKNERGALNELISPVEEIGLPHNCLEQDPMGAVGRLRDNDKKHHFQVRIPDHITTMNQT
jgi:hypothetical protein